MDINAEVFFEEITAYVYNLKKRSDVHGKCE